ncbi:MAG: hypothetical protein NWE89_12250 [Candidatus Bathyarchaeota archaeon]|nr:hypothetical protein [Candidatus Bathyarchaeota archaeon]
MSFGAVVGGKGTDSTSALRIGLTGLKPIRVSEIIKQYGVKFKSVYTTYELDTEITSFEDFTSLRYNQIFSNIKIPDYFDRQKLAEYYTSRAIENYNEDKEYKKRIEEVKRTRGNLSPFIDFVKYVKIRYQEDINQLYIVNAQNFYSSDLPLSVYNDFSRTSHLNSSFFNLLHHTLIYYDRRIISSARGNQIKFNKIFQTMKGELDLIFDLVDDMIFKEKCLQRLIIIWNAEDYVQLDEIKKIYFSKIRKDEFNKWYYGLKNSIRETRFNILTNKYYREDDNLDIKPPQTQYESQDLLKNLFYQDELKVPLWQRQ